MNIEQHCNLCDNIKRNLQDGIICGLTNQKPIFKEICPKIQLGKEFEKKLGFTHIRIERLKKRKTSIYFYSFVYMILGPILILSQRSIFIDFDFTYGKYVEWSISLLVVLLGFLLCGLTYSNLNRYKKKVKIVNDDKAKMDIVLSKYQIEYSCSVEFGKKYHGIQEVIVELKSNNNLLKDSKITYQV